MLQNSLSAMSVFILTLCFNYLDGIPGLINGHTVSAGLHGRIEEIRLLKHGGFAISF